MSVAAIGGYARAGWAPRMGRGAARLLVPAGLFALWALAVDRAWMSPQVLPAPALVGGTALDLLSSDLFPNLLISLRRLVLGLAAGVALGACLGVAMGLSRRAEAAIYPTFIALVQIPTLAWIPLLIMVLGLGEALKLAIILEAVATPVAINTHVGVRDIEPRLREAARVLRLPRRLLLLRLVAPAALPSFMTGLRLGLARGWTSLLAVELLASSEGIGYLMVYGRQLFQMDVVFVCIAAIGVVGVAMDAGFAGLDRAIMRWPPPSLADRRGGVAIADRWISLALPAALLFAWAAATGAGWIGSKLLPSPWTVLAAIVGGFSDGSLPQAMAASLWRWLAGLAIGSACGLAVGLVTGLARPVGLLLGPTLAALRLVAIFAWLPLLTAWVGLGDGAKVAFVAIACFHTMQLATQRGVAMLSPQLGEAARALRLGPWRRLTILVLPGAAPAIFAGLRLALAQGWIAAVGAEYFMASGQGIGSLMINAQQVFRMDVVIGAMVLIGLAGAAIGWAGRALEARASRWRDA